MHKSLFYFLTKLLSEYDNLCLFTLYKYPKFKIKNLLNLRVYKTKFKILSFLHIMINLKT